MLSEIQMHSSSFTDFREAWLRVQWYQRKKKKVTLELKFICQSFTWDHIIVEVMKRPATTYGSSLRFRQNQIIWSLKKKITTAELFRALDPCIRPWGGFNAI